LTATPYDGSAKPFTIGLKPLDIAEWLDVDEEFATYIAEKRRLYAAEINNVLVAEDGTQDAQAEVLALVEAQLGIEAKRPLQTRAGEDYHARIAQAGLLVQEDLVLMRRSPDSWRLVAASVCFPSAWSLREKFGKALGEVHAPVPGFNTGTRNAALIERMFDNLWPEKPVMRWNWTLFGDTPLYHPVAEGGVKRRFGDGVLADGITIRMERQTLRKLPQSGDILFTIRTYREPIATLQRRADGAGLAQAIYDQLAAFTDDELRYKGLVTDRPRIFARLRHIIDGGSS
jgi:dimethylamine monooxygenase subunit A